jgi:general stress protein YciG
MANTSKRGFASMDNEKQRLIASKGGRAAHAKGTAHEWSPEEARAAGRKGGESRGTRGRSDNPFASGTAGLATAGNASPTGIGEGLIGASPLSGATLRSNDLTSSFLAEAGSSLRNLNQNAVQSGVNQNSQQTTQASANA